MSAKTIKQRGHRPLGACFFCLNGDSHIRSVATCQRRQYGGIFDYISHTTICFHHTLILLHNKDCIPHILLKDNHEQKQWIRTFCSPPHMRSDTATQDGTSIWAFDYKATRNHGIYSHTWSYSLDNISSQT